MDILLRCSETEVSGLSLRAKGSPQLNVVVFESKVMPIHLSRSANGSGDLSHSPFPPTPAKTSDMSALPFMDKVC